MKNLLFFELYKIFRKWRSYIGFFAITALVLIIEFSIYYEGNKYPGYLTRNLSDSFYFTGNLLNGYLISYYVMMLLVIHIPFLLTLVAGDLLAGEATMGTYRMLVSRPVSRFRIVTVKFLAGQIYSLLMLLWLAFLCLGLGTALFGTGELIVMQDIITVFAANDVLWRFLPAYLLAVLSMGVVVSLAFLFSSLVENAIGPIIATMAVLIVFNILSVIEIDFFAALKPYLFTSYAQDWKLFFNAELDTAGIFKSAAVMLFHIVLFYSVTLFVFTKKDILS